MNKENFIWLITTIGSFLAPAGLILLSVGAFIAVDTALGWYKHKAKPTGANSKGLRMGFGKKSILYCGIVVSFYILDVAMVNEMLIRVVPFDFIATKAVALFLIWVEILSINENFTELKGISIPEAFRKFVKGAKEVRSSVKKIKE